MPYDRKLGYAPNPKLIGALRPEELTSFWSFVRERYAIWHRKTIEKLPRPWTSDPILNRYHFPNVYRHLDTGSIWIESFLRSFPPRSYRELLHMLVVYRCVNRVSTFQMLQMPRNDREREAFLIQLDLCRASKIPMVTGRHQPNLTALRETRGFLTDETMHAFINTTTGREAALVLRRQKWMGDFFCHQVVADYIRTPWSHLDVDTPTIIATGSRLACETIVTGELGRNYSRYRMARRNFTPDEAWVLDHLHAHQELADARYEMPPLTYVDIEHALCEWYRWRMIHAGLKGEQKNSKLALYKPRAA